MLVFRSNANRSNSTVGETCFSFIVRMLVFDSLLMISHRVGSRSVFRTKLTYTHSKIRKLNYWTFQKSNDCFTHTNTHWHRMKKKKKNSVLFALKALLSYTSWARFLSVYLFFYSPFLAFPSVEMSITLCVCVPRGEKHSLCNSSLRKRAPSANDASLYESQWMIYKEARFKSMASSFDFVCGRFFSFLFLLYVCDFHSC